MSNPKMIRFAECPVCGNQQVVRMPEGWQQQVNEEGRGIPIIACGNPWHYAMASTEAIQAVLVGQEP